MLPPKLIKMVVVVMMMVMIREGGGQRCLVKILSYNGPIQRENWSGSAKLCQLISLFLITLLGLFTLINL